MLLLGPQTIGRCSWPAARHLPLKTKPLAVWSSCYPEVLIPTWWTGEGSGWVHVSGQNVYRSSSAVRTVPTRPNRSTPGVTSGERKETKSNVL